jgi:integrase
MELFKRDDSPYWYFAADVDGTPVRRSTRVYADRTRRKEALAAADQIVTEVRRAQATKAGALLASVLEDMLTNREDLTASSKKRYHDAAVSFLAALPKTRVMIVEVTPSWVRQQFAELRKTSTANEMRWHRLVLKLGMEHAISIGIRGAPEVNPVALVGRITPKKDKHRKRRAVPAALLLKLLDGVAGDPFWEPFLTLILETGMRHREALGLQWKEVDLKRGFITLPPDREKTGRGRVVPLTDAAVTALRTVWKSMEYPMGSVWISARTRKPLVDIDLRWRNLRTRLELGPIRIHDLRHSFVTQSRVAGLNQEDRMAIVGHISEESHAIYSNTELDELRKNLNKHSVISHLSQQRQSTRN